MKLAIYACIVGILLLFAIYVFNQPSVFISGTGGTTVVDANLGLIDLNDGETSYAGSAGKVVTVNSLETGWEFADANGGGSGTDTNNTSCTVTVAPSGADYTDIPSAVDALATTGGKVCISSGTFTLTRAIDINHANIQIVGNGVTSVIRNNPVAIPTAMKVGNNTQLSGILIANLSFFVSTAPGNGLALDASNFAISKIENIWINNYNRGIDFNRNNTFYNHVDNVRIAVSGVGAFGIRLNDGAHENTIFRTRIITDGNGTGILLAGSHGNSLYETNVESGSAVGIDVGTGAHDTTINGAYLEGNIINLRLASGVESTTVIGGTIELGTTADIQNNGATGYNQIGTQVTFDPSNNQLSDTDLNGTFTVNPNDTNAINVRGANTEIAFTVDQNGNMFLDGNSNAYQYVSRPAPLQGVGRNASASLIIPSNTCAFAVAGSTSCFDFNANMRLVGILDGAIRDWAWGTTGNAGGLLRQRARTIYPVWAGSNARSTSDTFAFDFGDMHRSVQRMRWEDTNYRFENAKIYLGISFDGINDQNTMGDQNGFGNTYQDGNSQITGNLTVDKNVFGQLISPGTAIGTSCNTVCGAVNYAGPWVCVEATSLAGVTSTCGDITIAKTCLCQN